MSDLHFDIREFNTNDAGPRMNVGEFPNSLRGITIQCYLDKLSLHGKTPEAQRQALLAAMYTWKQAGAVGFAPHGFTTSLPAQVPEYVEMCSTVNLLCVPAFGLNEEDPKGKGDRIAADLGHPGVAAGIMDEETSWEGHPSQFDGDAAISMGTELTSLLPGIVLIHQPWPVIQAHRSFPQVAFNRFSSANGPQFYTNVYASAYGARRVRVKMPQFAENWTVLERDVLVPSGVGGVPRIVTVEGQGYGDGAQYDYTAYVIATETIIFWSEPFPDAACLHAMEARRLIDERVGLYVNGIWSGEDAVRRFQVWHNAQPGSKQLLVDGVYGPKTDTALFM